MDFRFYARDCKDNFLCLKVYVSTRFPSVLHILGQNSPPVTRTVKGKPEELKRTESQIRGSGVEFWFCSLSYHLQHKVASVYLIKGIAVILETVLFIGWDSKSKIWLHLDDTLNI